MSASLTGVTCPICGESVSAPCQLSGGCPGDYDNPPEGPEVDWDVDDFEPDCECMIQIEDNAPRTRGMAYVYNSKKHKQMLAILIDELPRLARVKGFHARMARLSYLVSRLAGVQDKVPKRDEDGKAVWIEKQPLLEAYKDAMNHMAENSEYEYEPDEPDYDPDDRLDRLSWDRGTY